MELVEVLTRVYPLSAQAYTANSKRCSLNFNKIPQSFSDIFGKKSAIGTEVHLFGIKELKKLSPYFDYFRL